MTEADQLQAMRNQKMALDLEISAREAEALGARACNAETAPEILRQSKINRLELTMKIRAQLDVLFDMYENIVSDLLGDEGDDGTSGDQEPPSKAVGP